MNKIKRGVSLLLCSLLFGSAVTLGNVADVQAGKQIKTETKQTINNTKTKKKVSDDQTSGKTGRNEENKAANWQMVSGLNLIKCRRNMQVSTEQKLQFRNPRKEWLLL